MLGTFNCLGKDSRICIVTGVSKQGVQFFHIGILKYMFLAKCLLKVFKRTLALWQPLKLGSFLRSLFKGLVTSANNGTNFL